MDQDDQPAWYDELMAAYVKGLDRELTALAAGAAIRDFVPCPGLRS